MKALVVSNLGRHFNLFGHSDFRVLKNMGIEVHVAANFKGQLDAFDDETVVKHQIDFERSPFSIKNIKAAMQMRNLIKRNDYDLIHCHSPSGGVTTRLGARMTKFKPIIYTAHGFHFYKGAPIRHLNSIYYVIEWIMARWTDGIITINREDLYAAERMPIRNKGKAFLIPSIGVEVSKYNLENKENRAVIRKQLGLSEDDFVIVVIAELTKRKNHKQILESIRVLEDKSCHLLVVGTGIFLNELEVFVQENKIDSQVHFLGYRKDIAELLNASDVSVLASLNEGFGMCILESMAAGLPVIATKTKGAKESIIDGFNGFLVDINDSQRLAEKLNLLKTNKNLRFVMGNRSKERAHEFSIEQTQKIMEQVYRLFLTNKGGTDEGFIERSGPSL